MSALFAFKLTLVPFFILALSLAGRRWGTAVSGWLVALPVVAGPIVFFIGIGAGGGVRRGSGARDDRRARLAGRLQPRLQPRCPSDGMGAEPAGRLGRVFPLHVPPEPITPHAAAVDRARPFRAGRGVPSPAAGGFRGVAARDACLGDRRPHGGGGRHGAPHDRPCPAARAAPRGAFRPVSRRGDGARRLHAPLPGQAPPRSACCGGSSPVSGRWGSFSWSSRGRSSGLGVGASFALAVAADLACNGGSLWALRWIRTARASRSIS